MAITAIDIVSTVWTRITTAGQSGTCWKKTGNPILVSHTDAESAAILPLLNINVTITKAKRVPLDGDNNEVLNLPADNTSDIYYGLALEGDSNILAVDVI